MSTVILFIACEVSEHLSVHDNDGDALDALTRYVDDHWADAKLSSETAHPDPAARIDAWFNATQALYVIAEASLDAEQL